MRTPSWWDEDKHRWCPLCGGVQEICFFPSMKEPRVDKKTGEVKQRWQKSYRHIDYGEGQACKKSKQQRPWWEPKPTTVAVAPVTVIRLQGKENYAEYLRRTRTS